MHQGQAVLMAVGVLVHRLDQANPAGAFSAAFSLLSSGVWHLHQPSFPNLTHEPSEQP